MTDKKTIRVMWLLGHQTARQFEISMLKQIGIKEIFLPKIMSADILHRSTSVDYSEDSNLTIPPEALAKLNATDWFHSPSQASWEIANQYFDVLFFVLLHPALLSSIAKHFKGVVLWRAYGIGRYLRYSDILTKYDIDKYALSLGDRFYFAPAYAHLSQIESDFLKKRAVYLPLGMSDYEIKNQWQGQEKKIFIICPEIMTITYYQDIYQQFIHEFKGYPYVIGGAQFVSCPDPNVLGYVPKEQHEFHMQQMRVMFYHSREPNHIHYHPFEAIRAGMPLIFMAGGLLDRFGGKKLPGRCKSFREARRKIDRILNDDWAFIETIRQSQQCLLDPMKPENTLEDWRSGFNHILTHINAIQAINLHHVSSRKKRIAVLLPVAYRGGTLRAAKQLAQAILLGSQQSGEDVEIVFGHLDDARVYTEEDFADLPPTIQRRPFRWLILGRTEAHRALIYANKKQVRENFYAKWHTPTKYQVPDDGMQQFTDCDLWVFVSDRLDHAVLPLRDYVLIVYDYLQRYYPILREMTNQQYIQAAKSAKKVLVTTEFTKQDAIQFAELPEMSIIKVPMLIEFFSDEIPTSIQEKNSSYFLWSTNLSPHKNQLNAFKALRIYYEENNGTLACYVTGCNTQELFTTHSSYLKALEDRSSFSELSKHIMVLGELPEKKYRSTLSNSCFLWHPTAIDNGTFSVVEAAQLSVPSLSSDYPAMREMDELFQLNLTWMDQHNPQEMANQLKAMEIKTTSQNYTYPSSSLLWNYTLDKVAKVYWEAIKTCL